MSSIDNSLEEINNLTIEITEIPAPPFMEEERALFLEQKFREFGYQIWKDPIGNLYASLSYQSTRPLVIVSAHIDTVFQDEQIEVVRDGDILRAPGIGDDSRGLANLLTIAKLLRNVETRNPILYVATVGEEGLGDLRGVKAVFSNSKYTPDKVKAFVTIDGTGTSRIVDQGVGSIRYMISFKGPGGHSYGSFGMVNPGFAVGSFLDKLGKHTVPEAPRTTFSVGTFEGGTSINSIPEQVTVSIDLRSVSTEELQTLAEFVKRFAITAVNEENQLREGEIILEFREVGNRPAGKLDEDSFLRSILAKIHGELDIELEYGASSTDANVPLDLGIPAISVASVEEAGRAHSQDEWIMADLDSLISVKRNLLLVLVLAHVA